MNEAEYHTFYKNEESFWWFTGMRCILFSILEKYLKSPGRRLKYLDMGCGTGGRLQYLNRRMQNGGNSVATFGFDLHPLAVHYCKLRRLDRIVRASAERIPFKDGQFDVVGCFDVLQNIRDDMSAVREIHRVCRRGGKVLFNEVAFMFLLDENSVAAGVVRRYTRDELVGKLEEAGFRILRATYANSILFLPITVVRLFTKRLHRVKDMSRAVGSVRPYPRILNSLLHNLLVLEKNALRCVNFPFGVSVIVLAEKKS
ncbi:MAG: class I SAM-dependent methyltransferase [Candidatus Tritonobacter lacicola]|nr:class I SAM-dependent methyltransferase [Candidatus Tritonobacter lacicola]